MELAGYQILFLLVISSKIIIYFFIYNEYLFWDNFKKNMV